MKARRVIVDAQGNIFAAEVRPYWLMMYVK